MFSDGGVLNISHLEEVSGITQILMQGLLLTASLGMPWSPSPDEHDYIAGKGDVWGSLLKLLA